MLARKRLFGQVISDENLTEAWHIVPVFEAEFEETSFGYRPGRSTQEALEHVAQLANQGFLWAVHLDIENCFESINLARLERLLAHKIKDRRLRRLIHHWLTLERVHVGQRGVVRKEPPHGLLQGSPLSPVLANVYLDQFDKLVRRKGLQTVRYADDIIVLCRTRPEAEKALKTVRKLLISLDLDLNPSKTSILHVEEGLHFLGGTLVYCPKEDGDGVWTPAFPEHDEEQESELA